MRQWMNLLVASVVFVSCQAAFADDAELRIAVFEADITPPLGTPLCDALVKPAAEIVDRLLARGVVLLGADRPIVWCALDWVGIGNSGYDDFRAALAEAAATTPERVALHCLHQHDAPGCDFLADELLVKQGLSNQLFDVPFARQAIARVADALKASLADTRRVTHAGYSKARVAEVASNRRVLGADGKVKAVRYSSTKDPAVRAEPEGTIDPFVHLVAFYDGETPLATMTYYATHPQSYYGRGGVSCDFPGLARGMRDVEQPGVFHVHFNGAGGNVTAGKYNDGAEDNRLRLASRLASGMKAAADAVERYPLTPADVSWNVRRVALPPARALDLAQLKQRVADDNAKLSDRLRSARNLAWKLRCESGEKIDIAAWQLGPIAGLSMPGELFVEYQLAAQQMRPGRPVVMAAYGDYAPGYIGTAVAYTQGGYETGSVSRVAPEVEQVLMDAMRELLK